MSSFNLTPPQFSMSINQRWPYFPSQLDSIFCRFEPLSGSCLADAFNFSIASVHDMGNGASNESRSDPINWLDTYECSQHLLDMLNCQEMGEPLRGSPIGLFDPLVTSQLLSVSGSSLGVSTDSKQCMTWMGILAPVLSFAKSLVYTLGPAHVSAVQKASKFVYTHSDSLLTVGASASAIRLVSALTQEGFQEGGEGSAESEKQEQLVLSTLEWLQGEESLAHLYSFILCSRAPIALNE